MKTLTLLLSLFVSTSVIAQTASNFIITDIDGHSRDLFSELDAGNVVVLKFFTNWCSICNNTADEVVSVYNGYQTNEDPVVFWALDRDPNETNAHATTYRNNNSIPFPVIGEASSVAAQFGVQYQPEYRVVRPDRSYVSVASWGGLNAAIDAALTSIATNIGDVVGGYDFVVAENVLTWKAPASEKAEIVVTDASGRLVVKQPLAGEQSLRLQNLNAGVYIYRLMKNNEVLVTGKIGLAQ